MTPDDVSVVIPTLKEASNLPACVDSVRLGGAGEIIVVDGGSTDETCNVAHQLQVDQVVSSARGRGHQLAEGLEVSRGDYVLFLHADNRLHRQSLGELCQQQAKQAATQVPLVWGAFHQRIDSNRWIYRLIEWGNAARVRYRSIALGDQAIFAHRETLRSLGGIARIPLMEDVELSKRLRKHSRPVLLTSPVEVSAKRWEETGVIRQTLRNWRLQRLYSANTPVEQLVKLYDQ